MCASASILALRSRARGAGRVPLIADFGCAGLRTLSQYKHTPTSALTRAYWLSTLAVPNAEKWLSKLAQLSYILVCDRYAPSAPPSSNFSLSRFSGFFAPLLHNMGRLPGRSNRRHKPPTALLTSVLGCSSSSPLPLSISPFRLRSSFSSYTLHSSFSPIPPASLHALTHSCSAPITQRTLPRVHCLQPYMHAAIRTPSSAPNIGRGIWREEPYTWLWPFSGSTCDCRRPPSLYVLFRPLCAHFHTHTPVLQARVLQFANTAWASVFC